MQRIFIKKCFLFTVGSVCRVKRYTTGVEKFLQGRSKFAMIPGPGAEWLRQQSKNFYTMGLDALVNRWDKRIKVEYIKK
jgi:hypothetical protein